MGPFLVANQYSYKELNRPANNGGIKASKN
jgi:hypothetical protein